MQIQIHVPEAPREPLEHGASSRSEQWKIAWSVGRAGSATSRAGSGGPGYFGQRAQRLKMPDPKTAEISPSHARWPR
eukprot:2383510-Alexandrium_andersonii.AAC.1